MEESDQGLSPGGKSLFQKFLESQPKVDNSDWFDEEIKMSKKKDKDYDPTTASAEETHKRRGNFLDALVEEGNEDLDKVDQEAGKKWARHQRREALKKAAEPHYVDAEDRYVEKALSRSTKLHNDAADRELEALEDAQAERIAQKVLKGLWRLLDVVYGDEHCASPGGDVRNISSDEEKE